MLGKLLLGTTIALPVGAYIYSRLKGDSKSDENIQLKDQSQQPPTQPSTQSPTQPPTQQQSTEQTKPRKTVTKSTISQTTRQTQNQTPSTPTVGAFLPELLKLYQLSNALAQQYEEEAKAYYQVFQEYSERLDKLLQYLSMSLAKTPLGMMSGFDLPDIIENLLKYYSWDYAKQVFPKVLTGYYILKANGHEDLSRYTIEDLITASENPVLAEAIGQNVYNTLLNLAENYKLIMQSALDQIGKLKDFYTYRLNLLNTQANLIKGIIDAILKEEKQNFEKFIKMQDISIKGLKAQADIFYKFAKLGLDREKFEWQKQQKQQIPLIQIERRK
ncbi:cell division protein [uncultured virus]|uniref:Cell division protein n=1 Tax=uncultured virus TaxID=340016 RepID=A0A5Q0TWJ6_9VIRU|nr:cell division protein [uncultured virus]